MFSIFPIKGFIDQIDGFYCDGVSAGLKPNNKKDIGFIYSDTLCDVGAVLTNNKFQAAPLRHYQRYENDFKTNFVLINSKMQMHLRVKKVLKILIQYFLH